MQYDFYAYKNDIKQILDFIFNELGLQLYDCYSEIGKAIIEYKNADDFFLHNDMSNKRSFDTLCLYHSKFGSQPTMRKISLNSGKIRYAMEGVNIIHLNFGVLEKEGLQLSFLLYHSKKSALKHNDQDIVSQVNWEEIAGVVRKLKYFINKKLTVKKMGKYPILNDANQLAESGCDLRCFNISLKDVI